MKKALPRPLFKVILFIWQKIVVHVVATLDKVRLRNFNSARLITLHHKDTTFSLYISPENGFIDKHIFLYGVYEPFMLDIIKAHLKPGMTFVDIGANIGQHTMYAAMLVGKHGSVHSFEPIPKIYNQLISSKEANNLSDRVHANNSALGNRTENLKLYVSENIGGSSLVNQEESKEEIDVSVVYGDDALLHLPSAHMIKIDVEGYELEVLEGIEKSLLKHRPIILIEYSGEFYNKQSSDHGRKILDLLTRTSYKLFDIEDDLREISSVEHFLGEFKTRRKQTNLLCLPQ